MNARSYSSLFWMLAGGVLFVLFIFAALTLIANPGARLPPAAHITVPAQ